MPFGLNKGNDGTCRDYVIDMNQTVKRRKAYALHRMSQAIDRILCDSSKEEKAQAVKWVKAWTECHTTLMEQGELICGGGVDQVLLLMATLGHVKVVRNQIQQCTGICRLLKELTRDR